MTTPLLSLPAVGACRCGRVTFSIAAPPLITLACHCHGCQRMTGSAFSLSAAIPTSSFTVTSGAPVVGGVRGAHRQLFCDDCKSWLYTQPAGVDFFVNVRPTLLDDARWFVPFVETWTSEKLPWAQTPARHAFAALPDDGAWQPLMLEFAQLPSA